MVQQSSKQKISPIIRLGATFLSLIAFAVGFWHCHLGLKEMRPFEWEYGSIAIALIILLFLLISYFIAVAGRKVALVFYLICACFFIVFNLNFFYPSYLGRQLVKEEAIALNDTLQNYSNRVKLLNDADVSRVSELHTLQKNMYDEIDRQNGFGSRATDYLRQFNAITGGNLKPNIRQGQTKEEWHEIAVAYNERLEDEIKNYVIKQMKHGEAKDPEKVYAGREALEAINAEYTPVLKEIIADDERIKLEDVKNHPQINQLQHLVTDLDNATTQINEGSNSKVFPEKLEEAKTRNLGRIAHTLSSIMERIGHIDTWAMIFLCLFIDLIVPLGIYVLLQGNENAGSVRTGGNFHNSNKSFMEKLLGL
jgi:hypothetical protein